MEYNWAEVSMGFEVTKPTTFHKWVWFWQVGWHKVRGWAVEDRTWLKVKISREMRLEDYIYGDGGKVMGFASLELPAFGGGINRASSPSWRSRHDPA